MRKQGRRRTQTHTLPGSSGKGRKGMQVVWEAGSSWSNCCPGHNAGSCFPAQLSHHLSTALIHH